MPGDILIVEYLGTVDGLVPYARFRVAVYYMEYWSSVDGGSKIAGKLFIPVGRPPEDGWPVKLWLHGFGGPGSDFWGWPFTNDSWRGGRGFNAGVIFADHGFVCLCPWLPGAGPSEPFTSYSPLSVQRNAQAAFDGFKALRNLPEYFEEHKDLGNVSGVTVRLDFSRMVMSTNCISSPTLVYFAAHWREHPEAEGLRCLIADTFVPSVAYICHFLAPRSLKAPPEVASSILALWAGPVWCLADYKGWDKRIFFTEKATQLFETPVQTPAGVMSLMRSARLEPVEESQLGPKIYQAVKADLGREPTSEEIMNWIFTEDMVRLTKYDTIEGVVNDEFYRRYFSGCDPFFEENIKPFNPGIPLLVIANGDTRNVNPGMPSAEERFQEMTLPRIETLRSWGWTIHVYHEPGVEATSLSPTPGHSWTMKMLAEILYKGGLSPELSITAGGGEDQPDRGPPVYWLALALAFIVASAIYIRFRGR